MDAIILAGGENRRFQSHKGLAEINGRKIIETTSELLKKHFNAVYISTNEPELFFYLGLPMIGDVVEQRGPMTGIYSSLISTGAAELFVAACDMPFIRDEAVALIVKRYHGQDALLPMFQGRPYPLLGIYSQGIASAMEDRIRLDKRALWDLLGEKAVEYIPEAEVTEADPEGRSFVNVNTLEEYRKLTVHS
jgi:molybdopterin-guanine dinucleotide biosynthesis protein A